MSARLLRAHSGALTAGEGNADSHFHRQPGVNSARKAPRLSSSCNDAPESLNRQRKTRIDALAVHQNGTSPARALIRLFSLATSPWTAMADPPRDFTAPRRGNAFRIELAKRTIAAVLTGPSLAAASTSSYDSPLFRDMGTLACHS